MDADRELKSKGQNGNLAFTAPILL